MMSFPLSSVVIRTYDLGRPQGIGTTALTHSPIILVQTGAVYSKVTVLELYLSKKPEENGHTIFSVGDERYCCKTLVKMMPTNILRILKLQGEITLHTDPSPALEVALSANDSLSLAQEKKNLTGASAPGVA